jgi:hypothetical protein
MVICCETQTIRWGDLSVPWKDSAFLRDETFHQYLKETIATIQPETGLDHYSLQLTTKEILSSKYDHVDVQAMAQKQEHLTQRQREELGQLLSNFTTLFSGKLGCYSQGKVHLELNEHARPFHHRPYPVPHAHQQVFKEHRSANHGRSPSSLCRDGCVHR